MPRPKNPLTELDEELTAKLEKLRLKAMRKAGYDDVSKVASFHGIIGGKNNVYVDAIREVFLSPEQFINEWKEGALKSVMEQDALQIAKYKRRYQNSATHKIIKWLQIPAIREYTDIFLERNFYRQYEARTRNKPEDALWELWFGGKNQEYGLFITPRYRDGWENDVSEIRRAAFDYWTVGHVLTSGFIVPKRTKIHKVADLDSLFDLYQNIFVRMTGSVHSESFAAEYEAYVRDQDDPLKVPFLIPEFRYGGVERDHKYRLDFTILSASKKIKVGIELSPWSSHGKVRGKRVLQKEGGAAAVEAAQIKKWEADTTKRNEYFDKFGLTTITFTDTDLANIQKTFSRITKYLDPTVKKKSAGPTVASAIAEYQFDPENEDD